MNSGPPGLAPAAEIILMSRRRRVACVCLAGVVAAGVAQLIDPGGAAATLCLLASGVVLGELLVLRVEDGSAIPLSYAVLVVLASSFTLPQYTIAVLVAELVSTLVCMTDRGMKRRLATFVERITVAAATYAGYRLTWYLIPAAHRETVAGVLGALAAAALAQMIADVVVRRALHQGTTFSPRGRLAWLAIASSGMLMAIGYRGVNGDGRVGIWGPLLFSTPLLAAWYAFERLDSRDPVVPPDDRSAGDGARARWSRARRSCTNASPTLAIGNGRPARPDGAGRPRPRDGCAVASPRPGDARRARGPGAPCSRTPTWRR